MICTNEKQAMMVAIAGAKKMTAAGYTFEEIAPESYVVRGGTRTYYLELNDDMIEFMRGETCSCDFARANAQFGTCKHRVWLLSELAEQERIDAEATRRQDGIDDQSGTIADHAMQAAGM